jgi:hypothetical protein
MGRAELRMSAASFRQWLLGRIIDARCIYDSAPLSRRSPKYGASNVIGDYNERNEHNGRQQRCSRHGETDKHKSDNADGRLLARQSTHRIDPL